MADPARVLEEALELEPRQRARLAHEIIRSLDESDEDAAALWRAEVGRRIDEVENGTTELEDWELAYQRLRAAVQR
ncbi:MAG: addiction module protein [Deltaproteobacteria bacterium]|nr:addiction module protein [Deltaproteobacteria bacterium]